MKHPPWLGLAAASAGMFLVTLDITVNVALPNITQSFGTDAQTIQWIIILYVGCTTGLQLSLGSAADRHGLRRFYLLGIAIYTVAVALIGLAPSLNTVFGLRLLQAVGNGLIIATAPALVTALFPGEARGRALGTMTSISTLGILAGSLAGGWLVDTFEWPAIFLARLPFCVLAGVLAAIVLQEPARSNAVDAPFDFAGAAWLFFGLSGVIMFVTLGGRLGWSDRWIVLLAIISLMALVVFARIESRAQRPILHLDLLKHRVLSAASVAGFCLYMATFVNFFVLPYYVADVLHEGATAIGGLLVANGVAVAIAAPLGGWLADRLSAPVVATTALVLTGFALMTFVTLDTTSSITDVAVRMVFAGITFGIFQSCNASIIMGSVPLDRLGTGGAILALSRGLGTTTSVALMGPMFTVIHESNTTYGTQFMTAFRDIYWLAAAMVGASVIVSLFCWRWSRWKVAA